MCLTGNGTACTFHFCKDTGCNGELCILLRRVGRWIVHVTHNTFCVCDANYNVTLAAPLCVFYICRELNSDIVGTVIM